MQVFDFNWMIVNYLIQLQTYNFTFINSQVNALYNANVPPGTISKIMVSMHEGQIGTLLPKTIFNISERGRTLLDMADSILKETTDAEKTINYLNKYVCLLHVIHRLLYQLS